jgi:5-methylcytosine-specific restriction endonuclease McrA
MTSKKLIKQVWEKGKKIKGEDPNAWRKDRYGNKIRFGSYGTEGNYGWEIDHKNPKDRGGSDQLRNLQPLHWEENREKGAKTQHKGK